MKVIKHGNTLYDHCCCKCDCEFEYLEKEIIEEYGDDPFETSDNWFRSRYIECPECGTKFYHSVVINGVNCTSKWNDEIENRE